MHMLDTKPHVHTQMLVYMEWLGFKQKSVKFVLFGAHFYWLILLCLLLFNHFTIKTNMLMPTAFDPPVASVLCPAQPLNCSK